MDNLLKAHTSSQIEPIGTRRCRPPRNAETPGFCRDCLTPAPAGRRPLPGLRLPAPAAPPELFKLTIAHLDCDAFYAAIEKRDHPELADKPVIVGGGKRGVVATACYIARINGVRSAMPMFKALEACPEAVVIRPDMEKYSRVGREVRELMQALTPLVEPLSIDEAFMDMAGTERLHHGPPGRWRSPACQARIEKEIGITVSIGLSFNKFLAKIASDLDKPRGFSVIGEAEAPSFLADKPVGLIWGVGKAMQARLAADGIRTDRRAAAHGRGRARPPLRQHGPPAGAAFAGATTAAASSRTARPRASAPRPPSRRDLADPHELKAILRELSEKVSRRLKKAELAGVVVTLKLKTADFRLRTRSRHLADPTQLADRIFQAGSELLAREADGTTSSA